MPHKPEQCNEGGFKIPAHLVDVIAECARGQRLLFGPVSIATAYDKCWLCSKEQMFTPEDQSGGTCLWCGEQQNQHPAMKRLKLLLDGAT